jgi:hypothetical protein
MPLTEIEFLKLEEEIGEIKDLEERKNRVEELIGKVDNGTINSLSETFLNPESRAYILMKINEIDRRISTSPIRRTSVGLIPTFAFAQKAWEEGKNLNVDIRDIIKEELRKQKDNNENNSDEEWEKELQGVRNKRKQTITVETNNLRNKEKNNDPAFYFSSFQQISSKCLSPTPEEEKSSSEILYEEGKRSLTSEKGTIFSKSEPFANREDSEKRTKMDFRKTLEEKRLESLLNEEQKQTKIKLELVIKFEDNKFLFTFCFFLMITFIFLSRRNKKLEEKKISK